MLGLGLWKTNFTIYSASSTICKKINDICLNVIEFTRDFVSVLNYWFRPSSKRDYFYSIIEDYMEFEQILALREEERERQEFNFFFRNDQTNIGEHFQNALFDDVVEAPFYDDVWDLPEYIEDDGLPSWDQVPLTNIEIQKEASLFVFTTINYFKIIDSYQANYDIVNFPENFFNLNDAHSTTTINTRIAFTAFPRLGLEHIDGCDCWLPDPSRNLQIPKDIKNILFGKLQIRPSLLLGHSTWLIKQNFGTKNIVLTNLNDFWFVYEATDCHLGENKPSREEGHLFIEKKILRQFKDGLAVLKDLPISGCNDLSGLLEDQHNVVEITRSFLPTIQPSLDANDKKDFVYSGDTLMTREDKAYLRRERRAKNKELLKIGKKPEKWDVPVRFRGLTTQEYHEARQRELDDLNEWIKQQGRKALPQEVQNWLSSTQGSKNWNKIHNDAVTRHDFALNQLSKINKYLIQYCGLQVPLTLNQNLIEKMRKSQERSRALKQSQMDASINRVPNSQLAREYWINKKKMKKK